MLRTTPTLLRRVAPASAVTQAAAATQAAATNCAPDPPSSISPAFPPGFPSPMFAREALVWSLFPQLS